MTASVVGGSLHVFSKNSATLGITQTAASTYEITENGSVVATRTGVTRSLFVTLGKHTATDVTINLGGLATVKNVSVHLGNGVNGLGVANGTITGFLAVVGGNKADSVELGDGSTSLTVNGHTSINTLGGTDSFTARSGVTLRGRFSSTLVENVSFNAGSVVQKNAMIVGGHNGNTIHLNGTVNGGVWFTGSMTTDTSHATGAIGTSLSLVLKGGADTANRSGSIGKNLHVVAAAHGGGKTVNLGGTVGNNVNIELGRGADLVNFTGAISGVFQLHTGRGNDQVKFFDASTVSTARVNLGWGNDMFCLEALAVITGDGKINGAKGNDTFITELPAIPPNVAQSHFETLEVSTPC
ncbi:MAG: hypothetical protein FJ271_24515 [Planctomycetes bacterium]|nr:hypothetical protein [Planctomycetota bacterium]